MGREAPESISFELLRAGGPDIVNMATCVGVTMLHLASTHGEGEVVRYLVESAADVNKVNGKWKAPLDLAVPARQH